jgi:hypothetical protein
MPAKWTFMVYMAGFNNLTDFATKDLEEMRKVGSTDDVKVAVFIKQLDKDTASHIVVGKDGQGEQAETVGDADSGNPQTMLDFIRWAAQAAPAERYALVVWNHGSGWQPDDLEELYSHVRGGNGAGDGVTPRELGIRSTQEVARSLFSPTVEKILSLPTAGDRGIASDDGTGHSLDTIELNRVLEKAHQELGQPLALLGMDACLMSTFEVAYEGREHTTAVVGSEELEPGDGWPYSPILEDLNANPDMGGGDLGRVVVDRYVESYENLQGQWPVTQCAVTTERLGDFADAVDGLAQAIQAHMREAGDAADIIKAQARSVAFTGELVDVKTFCDALRALDVGDAVKDAAGKVLESLEPGRYVAAEGHLGPTVEGCGGVTLYFPPPLAKVSDYYKDLAFAQQRGWDEFLASYHSAVRGE